MRTRLTRTMARRVPDRPDVSVVTAGHDVADARLHRVVRGLQRAGLEVEVLGLGRATDAPDGARVRTWQRGGMAGRAVRSLVLPLLARGRVLLAIDPDTTIAVLVVGRVRRRAVVADVHEDYLALLADRAWARGVVGRGAALVARAAVVAAARADLTVVADEHVPPGAAGARERLVVRNLPDLGHVLGAAGGAASEAVSGTVSGPRRAVYVGDLRRSRGLVTMVEAVALAPGWELDLVGPVGTDDEDWLRRRTAGADLAGRVRAHGRMPPGAAWGVARGADVGLVLLEDTPAFREAVPSKLLEYLAAGLAVLATPLPRVAALVEASGAGALVQGPEQAAEQLRTWDRHPDVLAGHRAAARSWAAEQVAGPDGYDELAGRVAQLAARPPGRRP